MKLVRYMIKALIFDFDGLILETESPIFNSWNELYQSLGCKLPIDSWVTLIGGSDHLFDPYAELERQLGRPLDRTVIEPERRKREIALVDAQKILPGVIEYLSDAKQLGLKIGLASSSSCAWVTGHLTRLGIIHYFDCIRARDDVRQVKPFPELYIKVIRKLNIHSDEGIALEDSPHGIQAAKSADLYCVAVPNDMTRSLCLDHADLTLNSLEEMPLIKLITLAQSTKISDQILGFSY
jgi:HAD superfamily hydrolase (TIGR01509 family)